MSQLNLYICTLLPFESCVFTENNSLVVVTPDHPPASVAITLMVTMVIVMVILSYVGDDENGNIMIMIKNIKGTG